MEFFAIGFICGVLVGILLSGVGLIMLALARLSQERKLAAVARNKSAANSVQHVGEKIVAIIRNEKGEKNYVN